MMRYIVVFCMLLWATNGYSQFTLTGTVKDAKGKALIGADVYFKNLQLGTITNLDGAFTFHRLNEGTYELKVGFLGYEGHLQTITLLSDRYIDIILEPENYLANEVLVYGTRANSKFPMAYTNINKDEIQRMNTGNDITYMLAQSPSVVATSEAGIGIGYTAMRIRGTDPTRINVTMNGVPINDSESQTVFWVNMPDLSASVEDVQIQRGVGTSTQGAAAFGATVNFQTLGLSSKPYAEYQLIGGSFNTIKNTIKVSSGLIADHFSFDARLSKVNTDGYIKFSGSDHTSVFLSGAYHAKSSLLRFTFLNGRERTGISWWGVPQEMLDTDRRFNPAGLYYDADGNEHYYKDQTDNYRQTHYQLHFSQKLNKSLNLNIAAHYTQGGGYYEQFMDDSNSYHSTAFADYGLGDLIVVNGDTLFQSDLIRRKWLENDFYGIIGSLVFKQSRFEAMIGGGWNSYSGNHFGRILWMEYNIETAKDYEWYRNTGDKTDWNLYAKINYLLTRDITIFGDLQYRNIKYEMNGIDDDLVDLSQQHTFNFFNPKLGVFFAINSNNTAYVSGAIANREPARADFKESKGDPSATPQSERLYDVEIGYTLRGKNYSMGANLYYMHYKDQLVPTGEKSNVGYSIMTNVKNSYRRGIELTALYSPFSFLRWNFNITLSQNKINNYIEHATHYSNWNDDWQWFENEEDVARPLGATNIAYSPSVIGASAIEVEIIEGGSITLISKYVGKQYFDNTSNNDRRLDSYFVHDIRIEYAIPFKKIKHFGLLFQINNLFDMAYSNNAYGGNWYEDEQEMTWAYYYPQAGIHFFAGIGLIF
jgi:iron complex outermembrane recepter protein